MGQTLFKEQNLKYSKSKTEALSVGDKDIVSKEIIKEIGRDIFLPPKKFNFQTPKTNTLQNHKKHHHIPK